MKSKPNKIFYAYFWVPFGSGSVQVLDKFIVEAPDLSSARAHALRLADRGALKSGSLESEMSLRELSRAELRALNELFEPWHQYLCRLEHKHTTGLRKVAAKRRKSLHAKKTQNQKG
jgi:hypothetical protein